MPVVVPANAAAQVAAVDWPLAGLPEDVFFLDLAVTAPGGDVAAANRYPFARTPDLRPLLALPGTTLAAQAAGACPIWQVSLANTGQAAALGVQIEDARPPEAPGRLYFADNYFHLLPGERRVIEVTWHGPAGPCQRPASTAWNAIAPPLELC